MTRYVKFDDVLSIIFKKCKQYDMFSLSYSIYNEITKDLSNVEYVELNHDAITQTLREQQNQIEELKTTIKTIIKIYEQEDTNND